MDMAFTSFRSAAETTIYSDDLSNISGAMAHFYDGAESVCLSNGGMHEEPVQMLNAEFLWSGSAGEIP